MGLSTYQILQLVVLSVNPRIDLFNPLQLTLKNCFGDQVPAIFDTATSSVSMVPRGVLQQLQLCLLEVFYLDHEVVDTPLHPPE